MYSKFLWLLLFLLPGWLPGQQRCATIGDPARITEAPTLARTDQVFQVVVHIVYATEDENISDEIIRSQIDILNRDFNGQTPGQYRIQSDFRSLVSSPGWRFCMATTDPQGNPTNGIVRVPTNEQAVAHPGSLDRGLRKIKHTALGGSDAWDTDRYINIWVGHTGDDVVIGDATFPGQAKSGEDGVMVDVRVFGGMGFPLGYIPYHLGKTLTHELGHFFNLAHLSGNGNCNEDDGVEDTPLQDREYFDCPEGTVSSCGSEDMYQNFMSLAYDPCLLFFTKGQTERMESSLTQFRSGLMGQITACNNSPGDNRPLSGSLKVISSVASGQVLVLLDDYPENDITYTLFDLSGRELLSGNIREEVFISLETPHFPSGIYLLQFSNGSDRYTAKVIF